MTNILGRATRISPRTLVARERRFGEMSENALRSRVQIIAKILTTAKGARKIQPIGLMARLSFLPATLQTSPYGTGRR